MKKLALTAFCSIFALIIFTHKTQAYDHIDDALRNGISNGDIVLFGSYSSISGEEQLESDLSDSAYSAGSIALAYRSGFYKRLRFMVSFRASSVFWQDDSKSIWQSDINSPGRQNMVGDSSKDFYSDYRTMLGQSYLEYFDGDTSLKMGRIFAKSEWADRLIDGVILRNKSLENLLLEAMWAKSSGYVQSNKMTGLAVVNAYDSTGLVNLSARYSLGKNFWLKAYGIFTPTIFNAVGAKANFKYDSSNTYIGLSANFTSSFEQQNGLCARFDSVGVVKNDCANGIVFDARIYLGVKDFVGKLRNGLEISGGYIATGDNGIGSLNALGNNISPFFMWGGRAFLLGANAGLGYGKINFSIDRFSFALVYGSTRFNNAYSVGGYKVREFSESGTESVKSFAPNIRQNGGFERVNEVNLLAEIGMSEHTSILVNVLNTHGGKRLYFPHQTLANVGVKMAF